jgi:hypothetical protein
LDSGFLFKANYGTAVHAMLLFLLLKFSDQAQKKKGKPITAAQLRKTYR